MTRTVTRRPLTPIGLIRQRHGHKRKGEPVEAWKTDLEQDGNSEDVRIRGVNLNAIEQIANGVERMMFSWNLDTFERGQEHAKIFNATNPDTLLPVSITGDDEVRSSDPKVDSGKASTACQKFSTQQITAEVPGPACLTHDMDISRCRNLGESGIPKLHNNLHSNNSSARHGFAGVPKFADTMQSAYPSQALPQSLDWITNSPGDETTRSIVDTRAAFEVPGNPGVTIRQDMMSGGTVSKVRRDRVGTSRISTCEKNVGTEARNHQEWTPQENTNNVAMTEFSPQLSFRGMTPSADVQTFLPTPPPQRNYYPVKENSCSYQFPGFSVAERQLSPRKEEPIACHASTLTHSLSNFPHSRSETDTRLDKTTYIDVVARADAHTDSPNPYISKNTRPNSGAVSHSSSYYWRRPTETIETLEVGGRPVTMPALWNGTEALKNKFESLINMTSGASFTQGKERPCSVPPEISSMEELQLALIECATEYEIKTLDARMKMQEMRAQKRQITSYEYDRPASSHESQNHVKKMMSTCGGAKILQSQYALQQVQREGMRPEKVKENMEKPDLKPWKKKERSSPDLKKSESGIRAFSRLFDRQRRSLDDALNHVDRLQREVVKKDRELVEWQLKEKETKTQLHELEDKVKKTRVLQASSRLEPRKLLLALPALRESLRSLKAEEQKKIRSPLAETAQELSNLENKSMSEMSDQDCSLNTRLQCLEERTSEMDELKGTISKLASNMAELSMAFKDHVQFVNHRLGAIHGFVTKRNIPATSHISPELVPPYVSHRNAVGQLKLADLETVEAEREITRSQTPLGKII